MKWRVFIFSTALCMFAFPALLAGNPAMAMSERAPFRVAASILPLHGLLANIADEGQILPALLPPGASPHGYALRPSDARLIRDADVIFWVGPKLETPLVRPIAALSENTRIISLADQMQEQGPDFHIWLDPRKARAIARIMATTLAAAHPDAAPRYMDRLARLEERLITLDHRLEKNFQTVKDRPFVSTHGAYTHLEARYGLHTLGALQTATEQAPSAARLSEMRIRVRDMNSVCLFDDTPYRSRSVAAFAADTGARVVVLDPLGSRITPGPDAYFTLMESLGDNMISCLERSAG